MTIDELITKLEAAAGPDRELDGDIAEMFNPDHWRPEYIRGQARNYTASIDAALTLVPESRHWTLDSSTSTATVWRPDMTAAADEYQIHGATPAIALCIAALRARKAKAEQEKR